ncbi:MAG TPA: hypothetical protein VF421_00535 [Niabella sp.]
MMALSDALDSAMIRHVFFLREDNYWIQKITRNGKKVISGFSGTGELAALMISENITHLIYDTRNDLGKEDLDEIKKITGTRIIVNDSPEDTRLAADVNIFPPIAQLKEWSWGGFDGKIFSGWEYVMLRKDFLFPKTHISGHTQRVLLSFGSTDPFHITEKILHLLSGSGSWKNHFNFSLVCGPQFQRVEAIRSLPPFNDLSVELIVSPENIAEVYSKADFAIIAFGVTAYELAALHIPAFYVAISEDHARSAAIFERSRVGKLLGIADGFQSSFEETIDRFVNNNYVFDCKKENGQPTQWPEISNWNKILQAIIN